MAATASMSEISQLLSDAEMRLCLDISDALVQIESSNDFTFLVEHRVRRLIDHECSVCGFIDTGTYTVSNMLVMDYPQGFLDAIMYPSDSGKVIESPLVKTWSRESRVVYVNDYLAFNPRYARWTEAATKHHLKNMMVNGMQNPGDHRFSYFNFANHHRQVTEKEQRLMRVLTPHMHLALMRIQNNAQLARPDSPINLLSKREREVLNFIEKGLSNQQIAEHLCISPYTVKNHIRKIFEKLGVNNRVAAIAQSHIAG